MKTARLGLAAALVTTTLTCAVAAAAEKAPEGSPEDCRALHDSADRLACYDRMFGAPEGALVEQGSRPPPAVSEQQDSGIAERWELKSDEKQGTFRVSAYKPVYILAAYHSSRANESPSSPSEGHTVSSPLNLVNTETKYQISLKSKLWENVLSDYSDLWFGYTQTSRWQFFNASESRPFRETDYEPELMLAFRTHYSFLGWHGRLAGVSLTHQSNGRAVPLSRSWNRIVTPLGFDRPGWTLTVRPWWRLHEDRSSDDNPDIEDYMGRGDLLVTRNWRGHEISAMVRHSLRGGSRSHGALELSWAFPIHGELKGHLQFFSGYGESLIDYNHSANYVGLGVSLIEWYSHAAEGAQ